jgi:hypothetical protein
VKISFLSKYFLGHRSIISPPICVTCLAFQGCPGGEKNLQCQYQERVAARRWTENQLRKIPGQNLDLQLASALTPRYATASFQRTPRRLSFFFLWYEPGQVLNRRIEGLGNVDPLCQSYKFTFWLWRLTRSALPRDSLSTTHSYESLGRDGRHVPS